MVEQFLPRDLGRNVLFFYLIAILIFYYFPILMTIIFSFNSSSGLGLPLSGFSLQWYNLVLNSPTVLEAITTSVELAIIVAVITTVVALTSALALRKKFRGQNLILYLFLLGLTVPGIIYGLGELLFYSYSNVTLSFWTAVPIQVVYTVPFGLLLLLIRFNPSLALYENVARTLGAKEWKLFREVTFPLIRNEIVATALFGFTLSMSEIARTSLVLSGSPTLPIYTLSYISQFSLTPDFYALATIIIAISLAFITLVAVFTTRGGPSSSSLAIPPE